jgi:hypothetical protein
MGKRSNFERIPRDVTGGLQESQVLPRYTRPPFHREIFFGDRLNSWA